MKAQFVRKPNTVKELKNISESVSGNEFVTERIVELKAKDYEYFQNNLLDDFECIKSNIDLMRVDTDGVWHCILVREEENKEGILVESEGYEYARYAAYFYGEKVLE